MYNYLIMAKYYIPDDINTAERYNMQMVPIRQRQFLRPLTWLLSFPVTWIHHTKIKKIGMKGLKPPFLLLCNHNAFFDFQVTTRAIFPRRANYIISIDIFPGLDWIIRNVGGIYKRKFVTDTSVVRQLLTIVKNGDVAVLYPEARYSFVGTPCALPTSLGKLVKLLKVPVVTLIMNGNHINQPFWNLKERGTRTDATIRQLFTAEQVKAATVDEINQTLRDEFDYNDYKWQFQHKVRNNKPWRAERMEKVLYQCPHCKTEFKMETKGTEIFCTECGKVWQVTEYGQLKAARIGDKDLSGDESATEFQFIPDWFEWERANVHEEVMSGKYHMEGDVKVDNCPNKHGYVYIGEGRLVHDYSGFHVEGEGRYGHFEMTRKVADNYSCHVEFDFHKSGMDVVSISTPNDSFFIYCKEKSLSPVKMYFATEELYFNYFKLGETINGKPVSPHVADNMTHPKTEFGL